MRTTFRSRRCWLIVAAALLIGLAFFTLVSAANLNYATLQGVDGPLNAQQLEALRLSSALNATAVGIIVGVVFLGLFSALKGRSGLVAAGQ